jgi:DNA-binding NtrC family response regulator
MVNDSGVSSIIHNPYSHYPVNDNNNNSPILQNQNTNTTACAASTTTEQKPPLRKKRILIIDDHSDTALTFKAGLESIITNNKKEIEIYTYDDPLAALLEFKPNFYDLLLIDINLPYMNGFELSEKILKLDVNVKVCFMSAGEVNHEVVREIHPSLNIGCFIQKPVTIDYLVKRVKAELE